MVKDCLEEKVTLDVKIVQEVITALTIRMINPQYVLPESTQTKLKKCALPAQQITILTLVQSIVLLFLQVSHQPHKVLLQNVHIKLILIGEIKLVNHAQMVTFAQKRLATVMQQS